MRFLGLMSIRSALEKIPWMSWLESSILTIVFVVWGYYNNDPLALKGAFPWIWFAPVLVALRYGLWLSQWSIFLILCTFFISSTPANFTISAQLSCLGGFLLTVCCALFQKSWNKKIIRYGEVSEYLQNRIQMIAYSHQVLSLSYECIEQTYISQPTTLRSSLLELRELLGNSDARQATTLYARFLNLLTLQCHIEKAAIFPVEGQKFGDMPWAEVGGTVRPPRADDFLIQECLSRMAIAHVSVKASREEATPEHHRGISDYLVVIPIFDPNQCLIAILVVEAIPFMHLHDENINIMLVLTQYFTSGYLVEKAEDILNLYPCCPVDFANELQRLYAVYQNSLRDSAILVFRCKPHPQQKDYFYCLQQEKRGIDSRWFYRLGEQELLFLLMPMTGRAGVERYKIRINAILQKNFNLTLNEDVLQCVSSQLGEFSGPVPLLQFLMA